MGRPSCSHVAQVYDWVCRRPAAFCPTSAKNRKPPPTPGVVMRYKKDGNYDAYSFALDGIARITLRSGTERRSISISSAAPLNGSATCPP